MHWDVVIVGAGPAGLACAKTTAAGGASTLVLEKKIEIGAKICAGGITCNGILDDYLAICQKAFPTQHLFSPRQSLALTSATPIIATVNRKELGRLMAKEALAQGAVLRRQAQVISIDGNCLHYRCLASGKTEKIHFRTLVGADGSTSMVRRYLKLSVEAYGVGMHCQPVMDYSQMEWHLDGRSFASGYAWVFPHATTASIGIYADKRAISPVQLQKNFYRWAAQNGFDLRDEKLSAEKINFDYRGVAFDNIFLIGDAAGLASAITGEGIFPAMVSGRYVGARILDASHQDKAFDNLRKNSLRHRKLVEIAGKNRFTASLTGELSLLLLRLKLLDFTALEMARSTS